MDLEKLQAELAEELGPLEAELAKAEKALAPLDETLAKAQAYKEELADKVRDANTDALTATQARDLARREVMRLQRVIGDLKVSYGVQAVTQGINHG